MSLRMRRHARYPLNGKVRVAWEGASRQLVVVVAKIVDISQEGMQISCPEAIPVRTVIRFQFLDKYFEGSASVRSCTRQGINHRIGLEFGGGLRWVAPESQEATYTG